MSNNGHLDYCCAVSVRWLMPAVATDTLLKAPYAFDVSRASARLSRTQNTIMHTSYGKTANARSL
jgi:hypothetical protein